MNRRGFLLRSAQLGIFVSSGLMAACSKLNESDLPAAGVVLSSEQMYFFKRLSQVLLPTEGTALPSVDEVPVLVNLDSLMQTMSPSIRSDLGAAFNLFEYGGTVLGWNFSRFTRMKNEDAVRYIDSWQTGYSVQQGIVSVLKRLVYSSYWRDESTWPALEFDGPVSVRWGIPSLGEAPLPQR